MFKCNSNLNRCSNLNIHAVVVTLAKEKILLKNQFVKKLRSVFQSCIYLPVNIHSRHIDSVLPWVNMLIKDACMLTMHSVYITLFMFICILAGAFYFIDSIAYCKDIRIKLEVCSYKYLTFWPRYFYFIKNLFIS